MRFNYTHLKVFSPQVLYVLQIYQDSAANTAHVSSVSEFLLAQTCLSFAILDASKKKFKKVTEESHLDEITTGMTCTFDKMGKLTCPYS